MKGLPSLIATHKSVQKYFSLELPHLVVTVENRDLETKSEVILLIVHWIREKSMFEMSNNTMEINFKVFKKSTFYSLSKFIKKALKNDDEVDKINLIFESTPFDQFTGTITFFKTHTLIFIQFC